MGVLFPQGGALTHEVVIRLASGTSDDVLAGTVYSPFGLMVVDGMRPITGVGFRMVCVHYVDRPCGAFQ